MNTGNMCKRNQFKKEQENILRSSTGNKTNKTLLETFRAKHIEQKLF